ncbi:MAG: hypothetical protein MI974_06175 [Chitinophagales bacterium]|nr:hypothetical protein [Chitinophagales bacterium]
MNAWSTPSKLHTDKSTGAVAVLETLISPFSNSIINYLKNHGSASFSELILHTNLEATLLQDHLEQMCQIRVLKRIEDVIANDYAINYERLNRVKKAAKQLAAMVVIEE